jgi:mono/diheme cytochrome c family protein
MPFPWYTKATRDDVMAIKAYLFTLPAVRQVRPPNKLAFPFSVRESLLVWRAAFFNAGEFKADPQQSAEVNRGAYLVNGLAHCGECHNGRPVAGQSRYEKAFQGGVIDNWYAPNITSDVHDGVGGWTNDQLVTYLKTGMAPGKGIALGPMAETIQNLSHLKAADLQAIAAYLKATPATAEPHGKLSLFEGRDARGAQAYLNNCASCHGLEGKGLTQVVPALQGNGAVTAQGPQNVIQVVLGGLAAHGSYAPMLAVGAGMSDEEVADVTNFVRQIGGNVAPATATTGMVAELRGKTDTLMNGAPGTACPKIEEPALAKAVDASGIAAMLARMSDVTMLNVAHAVVSKLSKAAPAASQAALVNAITATYCPVLRQDTKLDANWKALKLGQFSALVYTEASSRDRPRQAALH